MARLQEIAAKRAEALRAADIAAQEAEQQPVFKELQLLTMKLLPFETPRSAISRLTGDQLIDVTGFCDLLMSRGMHDVYDSTKEQLLVILRSEVAALQAQGVEVDLVADEGLATEYVPDGGPMWIYTVHPSTLEFGPFDSTTMLSWQRQNLFGEHKVMIKEEGGTDWSDLSAVDMSLYVP